MRKSHLLFLLILLSCSSGRYSLPSKKPAHTDVTRPSLISSGKYREPIAYDKIKFSHLELNGQTQKSLDYLRAQNNWNFLYNVFNRSWYFYQQVLNDHTLKQYRQDFLNRISNLASKVVEQLATQVVNPRELASLAEKAEPDLNGQMSKAFHIPLIDIIERLPQGVTRYRLSYQNYEFINYHFFLSTKNDQYQEIIQVFSRKLKALPAFNEDLDFVKNRGQSEMDFLKSKLFFELKRQSTTKS